MKASDRRDIATILVSLALVAEPWLQDRRKRTIMEVHKNARQAGVVEGANAMFQELSALKGKMHDEAYQAFWRVYDRREQI